MFDFLSPITDAIGTIAQWVGYGLIFGAVVLALFVLVAVPVMVKLAAVAVARTAIVETAKLLAESGVAASFTKATNSVTTAANQLSAELQRSRAEHPATPTYEVIRLDGVEVK